ncbi:hypothetical protein LPJ66_001964 [Kickxella alabastrina]|uniref:Uncharacterized protein n=1 Tax=Kickxella alabastrina TaxID=61397 RepID=A0ACC1IRT3_9FUNG|nr:hypothetical protein LPJ66_001964 [Kickxella alabastrina]
MDTQFKVCQYIDGANLVFAAKFMSENTWVHIALCKIPENKYAEFRAWVASHMRDPTDIDALHYFLWRHMWVQPCGLMSGAVSEP